MRVGAWVMRTGAILRECLCVPAQSPSISSLESIMTTTKTDFDMESLRLNGRIPTSEKIKQRPKEGKWPYQTRSGEMFLKGPIPWPWLIHAAKRPGKALHVGIALWFYSGMTKLQTISLNQSRLIDMGVSRDSARRGLRALELGKLITVERHAGRKPIVTIVLNKTSPSARLKNRKENP